MNPILTDSSLFYAYILLFPLNKKKLEKTSGEYRTLQEKQFCNIKGTWHILEANSLYQQVGNILNDFINSIPFKQSWYHIIILLQFYSSEH